MIENRRSILNHDIFEFRMMDRNNKIITVGPESSIFETLKQMQMNFIKRIIVVSNKKPVGIVTERDINRFLENDKTARAINEIPIKNVMHKNVISIPDGLEDRYDQCASRMETFKIGSVVFVNDCGEVIGIVTRTDITKAYSKVFGGKYKVKEFMTSKVVTCRKSDSLEYALSLMNRNEISRLVVTDAKGSPLGIITTNTFLNHTDYFTEGSSDSRDYLLPKAREKMSVSDLINDELLVVSEEDDLAHAASIMINNKISGIPVVNEKKTLQGVVSKTDVVRAFTVVGPHEKLKSVYKELY